MRRLNGSRDGASIVEAPALLNVKLAMPAERLSLPADSRCKDSGFRGSYPTRRWLKTREYRHFCEPNQSLQAPMS